MRLTVVGCAGSFPSPSSPASCYLLEHDGHRLVLDLGNGAFGPLQALTDGGEVDAVLLSHLHLDHCADVGSMYVARTWAPGGPLAPVPVHGPPGTAARLASMYGDATPESLARAIEVHELEPTSAIGPFTVTVARVAHPVPAYGIRVEAGGVAVAYSGDTGPTEALVDLARGARLALFEASFLESDANPADLHLTAQEAAEHARQAGADELVLTHLVAWNDPAITEAEAAGAFSGPLRLARPGLAIDL